MILKVSPRPKTGRSYLSIVHGYRDREGKVRTKTIRSLGYVDELEKDYPDPIKYFRAVALSMEKKRREAKAQLEFSFSPDEAIDSTKTNRKNLGFVVLSALYHKLGLKTFFTNRDKRKQSDYSYDSAIRLLVFDRILNPGSRKASFEEQSSYFEKFNLSLDDLYRTLTRLACCKEHLLGHLDKAVRKHWDRDTSILYYDVTNYYFEIDAEDSLRRRGVSKEHRPNPIVQMGLFMDASGLPLSCDLYAGNANDCLTLLPSLKRWKDRLKYNKIIVVADRGLNTSDNTLACQASGNGYIFGQTVRGGDKDLKSYALDQQGYRSYQDKSRLKSRIIPRIVSYTDTDGREQKIDIDQKQVIFYSPEYDRRAKYEREKVAEKALDLIANPGKYTRATSVGAAQYVKGLAFNKTTGEVAEGRHLVLDEEKLKSQARFDGYYSIVTSELDMSDAEIVGAYRGLWEIEESFRITKSDLAARPVYLSRPDHIEAHFLICFLAITLLRLLERELDEKYPPARIIKSLKKMTGSYLKENYWLFDYTDDIIGECERAFGLNLSRRILSLKEIRALIGKSKKS